MSPKLLKRTLLAIWARYRRGILVVSSVAILSSISAFIYWRAYWGLVFSDGWGLVEDLSGGTKISLAVGGFSPVIFFMLRWLFTRKDPTMKREFIQEVAKPAIGTAAVYLCVIAFYIIFVAQPKLYQGKSAEAKATKDELDKLTPPGQDRPYMTLANQLAQEQANLAKEKERADEAEKRAEAEKILRIKALVSTNSNPSIAVLDEAIERIGREKDRMTITNNRPIKPILQQLQLQREENELQAKKSDVVRTDSIRPLYAYAKYAVSEFHKKISIQANKCGDECPPIIFPTFEEYSAKSRISTPENQIVSGTNCTWQASYRILASGGLILKVAGKKAAPATARVSMGTGLRTWLTISSASLQPQDSPFEDATNCISNIDSVINLLMDSQDEEFR